MTIEAKRDVFQVVLQIPMEMIKLNCVSNAIKLILFLLFKIFQSCLTCNGSEETDCLSCIGN